MRVKLILPQAIKFTTTLTVRISDVNYGGHLGNDAVLSLVHEARLQFLKSIGFSELDIGDGSALIMADAAVMYRAEAFHGDQIDIEVFVGEVDRSSFELFFRLVAKRDTTEIARVKTGLVGFSYQKRSISPLPEPFRLALLSP